MLKGTGASLGIGIGKAVLIENAMPEIKAYQVDNAEAEAERFLSVMEKTRTETAAMAENLSKKVGPKEAEILNGHVMLLSDPMLSDEIANKIKSEKTCAESAVEAVCNTYADMFAGMNDDLMQQRAADILDIKVRIEKNLLGMSTVDIGTLPEGSILVTRDLTPSMTAGLRPEMVNGILTEFGGRTSHSAILSRALEIPAVVAVKDLTAEVKTGDLIVFDGESGEVIVNPDEAVRKEYETKKEAVLKERRELEQYKGKPSVTKDGVKVEIVANIGKPEDARKALEYDAEGIGLFRTEFLLMERTSIPTEEEQFEAYKKVAGLMTGKPVIIRTFDIGGDKEIPYLGLEKDENPFLGYRAIRFCLDRKEDIYRPQLRALLRASAFGNIRIMIPLVTCVDEYRAAKAMIGEIMTELDREGISYNRDIQVGIMVETAAAAIMADVLAKEAAFFSIGTNDLTQYIMACDRGNKKISYLYSVFNPAVLRGIRRTILCAKEAGIPVGMCGEAAADKRLIPLLVAWGLDEFSMSASSVLRTRKLILSLDRGKLKEIEEKAMSLATEAEIRSYLENTIA
jgi:phosphotransferase system enzyme I (PtsI)